MDKHVRNFLRVLSFCGLAALAPSTAGAQTYCSSAPTCSYGDNINSFSTTGGLTNITNNNSYCNNGGYTYFSSQKHTGVMGSTVNYSVTTASYGELTSVWVDFNDDGDFYDAGEQVMVPSWQYGSPYNSSFTIPMTATPGMTRMRVACEYFGSLAVCGMTSSAWGEVEDYDFEIISPCTAVGTVSNSNVFARTATVSWTPVAGSAGYEYLASTSSIAPSGAGTAVSGTSANITGLDPATNYCVWVRNKCNATSFSQWKSTCFTTSNCSAPQVSFANITHNSALALWSSNNIATSYEYIYSTDPTTPATTAVGTPTTQSNFSMQGLLPETTYYVHIRMYCIGNEMSSWDTYQFTTMKECMAPEVNVIRAGPEPTAAEWPAVATAVAYEYAINTSATPPALGLTVYATNITINPLPNDKKAYYLHVRSKCVAIFNTSDWTTIQLREADPTAVTNVHGDQQMVQAYPNPVNNVITIQVDGAKPINGTVTVADVTGKLIMTTATTAAKTNIDMTGLAAGVYFIKYTNGSHSQSFRVNKL